MQLSTLFLDRDGVINTELPGDYVKTIDAFVFEEGVMEALQILQPSFRRTIIVTNQRGVGAGLMTIDELNAIHAYMLKQLSVAGIRIDAIFCATDEDRQSFRRKPNPWMGEQAKLQYPDIDFRKSLMIGNSESDLAFGRSLQMLTAFVDDKHRYNGTSALPLADCEGDSLAAIAQQFASVLLPRFSY